MVPRPTGDHLGRVTILDFVPWLFSFVAAARAPSLGSGSRGQWGRGSARARAARAEGSGEGVCAANRHQSESVRRSTDRHAVPSEQSPFGPERRPGVGWWGVVSGGSVAAQPARAGAPRAPVAGPSFLPFIPPPSLRGGRWRGGRGARGARGGARGGRRRRRHAAVARAARARARPHARLRARAASAGAGTARGGPAHALHGGGGARG